MWTVITRETERGTNIVSEEVLSREQALRMYTINNAYASFEENLKGSIEPGKFADLAVLSHDILTCPIDMIKDIEVLMTMVDGKIVYENDEMGQ
jgi:predicted amidohydrolase YtcJ